MKAFIVAVLIFAAMLEAAPVAAHTLDVTTARVSLRDGHVEVLVDVDAVSLLQASVGAGEASAIATADDAQLAAWVAAERADLERGAHLSTEDARSALVLRAFPSVAEVRRLAAARADAPSMHPSTSTVRFESPQRVPISRSLSISLSTQLGRVLFSFVQPTTELAAPGAAASFHVLVPANAATSERSTPQRPWLAALAAALGSLALLVRLLPRRSHAAGATPDP